jgi:hypothetical protein
MENAEPNRQVIIMGISPERIAHLTTVTVTSSETLLRPDGRAAIQIDTRDLGTIAFEVDQLAIDALRRSIAAAEAHLRQSKDRTRN